MDYEEFLPAQKSFALLAAYMNGSTVNAPVDGTPQRYTGAYTTENFLRILGVAPMMGRDFTKADNVPAHRRWRSSVMACGSAILAARPTSSAGRPDQRHARHHHRRDGEGLRVPHERGAVDPALQRVSAAAEKRSAQHEPRRAGGCSSPASRSTRRTSNSRRLPNASRPPIPTRTSSSTPAQVQPLLQTFTPRPLRGTLLTMLGFCVGVLLIACVNVMNMQFARATLRAKELAIRSSLGATRVRLIRQMLTESLLVAAIGAAVGVVLAYVSVGWLSATLRNLDNPPPSWITFDIDLPVLSFTVTAMLVAAIASGLLPAWISSRANVVGVLKEGGRGTPVARSIFVTRGLVVFQIVVTCILLIGSLLQVRSILAQQTIDYGYDTGGILSARMGLMDGDYPSQESRKLFYDRIVREFGNDPEFAAAALTNRFRMVFSGSGPVEIEGTRVQRQARSTERQLRADHRRLFRCDRPEVDRRTDVHVRRSRLPSPGGDRERRVCGKTLRRRARTWPPIPHDGRERPPAGSVAHHCRCRDDHPDARPIQQSER